MFGIEEAIKYFGVTPSKRQLAILADIPFSERVLEACKETHILVALFPLSILDLYRRVRDLDWTRYPLFCKNHQFRGNTYAKKRGKTQWGLIRKNPVKNSTYNNWDKQQALLDKDEETPQAQVMVYTILGHHLNTGEQLFLENDIRCSDSDRHRYSHVCISYCDCLYAEGDYLEGDERYNGLCVQFNYDDDSHVCIGLSAARKLSSQALSF